MTSILNILYSLSLIASGLLIGYLYRNRVPHGLSQTPEEINRLRRKLQATALLFVNPIAFGGAIWGLDLNDLRVITLPFLGAFAILLGGVLAYIASELLDLNRKQKGVFVTCGSFTNIGSIGSLVTYILLGEAAVALMPFYKLFETFIYYGIGFPYAKSTSDSLSEDVSIRDRVFAVLTDRFVLVAMSSMIFGLGLNLRGINRPGFYPAFNSVLIPLGTLLLLSSIGMAMRFGKMREYLREAGVLLFIKFVAVPGSVYLLGSYLGLGDVDGGLPLKVSVILASMPVAFTAMVPPTLYDLDLDLANTMWFVTTSSLMFVVPSLWLLLS
ncbi:hypothetical protein GF326_03550 [Candidatus Bathyarchaeota archaeon]|nr:hypothetical protein [Candidatus Bathyarchaeota archaeon]